mmetsp:Transcript_22675/g.53550  ORF Transcript_22675/g.53550 Transcript_22675/m.53550 type:complete len:495 (-) Transcript_22675:32-1516(-)
MASRRGDGDEKTGERAGKPEPGDYRERQELIERLLKDLEDVRNNPENYPDDPIDLGALETVEDDEVSVKKMCKLLTMESKDATPGGRKRLLAEGVLLARLSFLMAPEEVSEDFGWLVNASVTDIARRFETLDLRAQKPYKRDEDPEIDKQNAFNIYNSTAHHQRVVLELLPLLWVKGLCMFKEFKCDWNDKKFFLRAFVAMPALLHFDYCQGAAKKLMNDARQGANRAPIKVNKGWMCDMVLGDLYIRVVPQSEWKRRVVYQPVDKKQPKPYIDDYETVYEIVRPHLNTSSGNENYMAHLTYYGESDTKGVLLSGDQGRSLFSIHQLTLSVARHYLMDITLKCHHVKYPGMGILNGSLGDEPWSDVAYWSKFECSTLDGRDESLIEGGVSTNLFGVGAAMSEKKREENAEGLNNEEISRLCDGDHLFGRSKHTNGITRVMGCSHRENLVRSHVRGRFGDWLLPGRKGFCVLHKKKKHKQTQNDNSVPVGHRSRF